MIFLSVGSALPFDRLVEMLDRGVESGSVPDEVFAQIGAGNYVPRFMPSVRFLQRSEYDARFKAAIGVISHAGIGTIASAMREGKPLLVLPRDPALGELVDDHQIKTARMFADLGHILMFTEATQLAERLRVLLRFVPRPRRPNVEGVARCVGQHLYRFTAAAEIPHKNVPRSPLP